MMRAIVFLVQVLVCLTAVQAQWDPHVADGRSAIVHLFEWRFDDIADECENFLAPYGYAGVQVSPVAECYAIVSPDYDTDIQRPWFERYQPVSYIVYSRSGTDSDFAKMCDRCNAVGVRIYVDVVFNQMTGCCDSGYGLNGSYYDSNARSYEGVPYTSSNFHTSADCPSSDGGIDDYDNAQQVHNCELEGMADLNQSLDDTREKIIAYLNNLISLGAAGFRFDAAKHMWPSDLAYIYSAIDDLSTARGFDSGLRPFIYQEVPDLDDSEAVTAWDYVDIGRVTEFKYGSDLGAAFHGNNQLKWFVNWGEDWGLIDSDDALVFINNHDNQRDCNSDIITFREPKLLKMATAMMLAHPYGFPRIMSSYSWDRDCVDGSDVNYWVGPPHESDYEISHIEFNDDLSCQGDWECEHRWRQIYNMVKFRNHVGSADLVDWWDNGNYAIAFGRGSKGFILINDDDYTVSETFQTSLPAGQYCDIISGNLEDGACTGTTITVNSDGTAYISLSNNADDGVIAIATFAMIGSTDDTSDYSDYDDDTTC